MMKRTVAITGASGFIGGEMVQFYLSKGWSVVAMGRKDLKIDHPEFSCLKYDLFQENDLSPLLSVDVIIHCAFTVWSKNNPDADSINIKATESLAEFCEKNGKQFVFFSSFSAHQNATSHYGKHKYALEKLLESKHLVIKPGLVIGAHGLSANIQKIIEEKKFIPVIDGGTQPIQWILIITLCESVFYGVNEKFIGVFPLASSHSITFLVFMETIAAQKNKSPFFIFIPSFLVKLLIQVLGSRLSFTEENLKGLLQLRKFETKASLEKFNIQIKDL
ncbi:MAG: NAD-dependent epimerase/dehydratase family protein [Bacteroidota bacterium]|jgi:nucleoside-diphosphate-sugar epimerase